MTSLAASSHPVMLKPACLPAPLGLYSHASQVAPGNEMVFVACAAGRSWAHGQIVGPGDFGAQARQAFANVRAVLAGAGMGPEHVAKLTTYLSAAAFVQPFYEAREKVFTDWYPGGEFPPNTLLVVARLVRPDFMVEIEAVAARAPGT